jgi:hypothetical protein
MKQRFLLNLTNNVNKITCTESHYAALCTELDYLLQKYYMHSVA